MIKRYRRTGALIYAHTKVASNTAGSGTSTTQNYSTQVTDEPGAVVGFKVTIYSATSGGADYEVNSVSHVLNDTFNLTLDGSGQVTFTQFINIGTSTPGNTISVQLTIESTTIGTVDTINYFTNITKSI